MRPPVSPLAADTLRCPGGAEPAPRFGRLAWPRRRPYTLGAAGAAGAVDAGDAGSLGIIGQLPGFQGNVPLALKEIHGDANITKQGDTGWMYSTDPLYAEIADYWMKTLIADFGTDHW